MSFPNAYSQMIYNSAGEVIGWDNPSYDPSEYDDGFGPEPYEEGFYHDKPEEHTPECTDDTCETYLDHYNARLAGALAESWYYDMAEELNAQAVMDAESYIPRVGRRYVPNSPDAISYKEFVGVRHAEELPVTGSREDYVLAVVGNACGVAYMRPELGGLGVMHANTLRGAFL